MRKLYFLSITFVLLLITTQVTFAQAKIKIAAAPYATGDAADIWVDLNGVVGVTSFRITNTTSPKDVYSQRVLTAEEVTKGVIPLRVKVLKKDGAANIYYIDAFRLNRRVPEREYDPSNEVTITSFEDKNAANEDSPIQNQQNPRVGPEADREAPTPIKDQTTKATLRLQAPVLVTESSSVSVRVHRNGLPPSELGHYVVEVKNGETRILPDVAIDAEGGKVKDHQDIPLELTEGKNSIKIYPKVDGKLNKDAGGEILVECSFCKDAGSSASTRAILGFEQIGASSSGSKLSPFLDFYFDTPLTFSRKKKVNGKVVLVKCTANEDGCGPDGTKPVKRDVPLFSVWSSIKLSKIPVQRIVGFGTTSGFNTFINDENKPNELAESFDFLVGLQSPPIPLGGILGRGFFNGKSKLYLYFGAGAINPLSIDKTAQIFQIPQVPCPAKMMGCRGMDMINDPEFEEIFPEAVGKEHIAFVSPERDKFFRQYFAGLRLKTFFYEDGKQSNMFPAMFDVGIGQNEAITQTLRGMVIRADGSTPLPIKGGVLSVFGSVQMRLGRRVDQKVQTLFLAPADSDVSLSSPGVGIVPIGRYPNTVSNRDIFRIGIGLDLFRLFRIGNNDPAP